jgi:hypothetical protein
MTMGEVKRKLTDILSADVEAHEAELQDHPH